MGTVNKKLCIIGDGATGKTSLLYRLKNNLFDEKYEPTIFETESLSCEFKGQKVNLSLWNTAGQDDFDRIRMLAYEKTDVLLITLSVVNRASFRNVKDFWMKEFEKNRENLATQRSCWLGRNLT